MFKVNSWNIRHRLILVCAMFAVPLLASLGLYSVTVLRDFRFINRELTELRQLRATWRPLATGAPVDASALRAHIPEAAAGALILDAHAETYQLADLLTSSLMGVAVVDPATAPADARREQARLAADAAQSLSGVAARLPAGPVRQRLAHRARDIGELAASADGVTRPSAVAWWSDTVNDLETLLQQRRAEMTRNILLQALMVLVFTSAASALAVFVARGLSARVGRLVAQIDRLIRNDTSEVTPFLGDRQEIGRLAKGVEALRHALVDARLAWSEVLLNEMRYSLISEHMRDAVLLADLNGGIIFACTTPDVLSDAAEDLEGSSAWDLFTPNDAARLQADLGRDGMATHVCRLAAGKAVEVSIRPSADQEESLVFLLRLAPSEAKPAAKRPPARAAAGR